MTDPQFEAVFRKMADRAWEEHQRATNPDANPLAQFRDWTTQKTVERVLGKSDHWAFTRLTEAVTAGHMEAKREPRIKGQKGSTPILYRWKR